MTVALFRRQIESSINNKQSANDSKLKEQDLQKKKCGARNRRIDPTLWPKPPWREEDREEAGLEKENVPLKTEERLSGDCERKIKNNERDQRQCGRDAKNQKQRQH